MQSVEDQSRPADPLSPLTATAVVGLGSIAALALSVLTAKAYALLVGPSGVGLLALMHSVLVVGVMVASGGLAATAVRAMAAAPIESRLRVVTQRASVLVGFIGGTGAALILIIFREPFALAVFGSEGRSDMVVLVAFALMLSTGAAVQVAILTGLHRVRTVVVVNLGTSLAAAVVGIAFVVALGEAGLAPGVLATALVHFLLSRVALRMASENHHLDGSAPSVRRHACDLLLGGLPVAVGQLAGSGAVYLVPIVILQMQTTTEVGYYRAAAAVSVGYLTFFLASLSQDYYPRLSQTTDPARLRALVEKRMRLLMSLGVPIIMALLATSPWLVAALYTPEFLPANDVLRWQLVGDLLRLPSWVLVYVLLARDRPLPYVAAEMVGGAALLLATAVGLTYIGLTGVGVGYAVGQLIYLAVTLAFVWRLIGAAPGRLQAVVAGTAVASAVILVLPIPEVARMLSFGLAALAFAAIAWPRLYRLHKAGAL